VSGFSWVGSPAATELEQATLDWVASLLGLPDAFSHRRSGDVGGGVIQGTASEAVLVTLLAARARVLGPPPAMGGAEQGGGGAEPGGPSWGAGDGPRLVAYASAQAHSCVRKACMVAGVEHFREVPVREADAWGMQAADLRSLMAADRDRGLLPAFVCATFGTTGTSAVDDVAGVARVAREFGAWVHVDAAYAGAALMLPEVREATAGALGGLEGVDSFDFNPQ